MKVIVTGCMGFIGSNLVPYLLNNGFEVIGIDNLLNPSLMPTDRMKAATPHWDKFKFWNADIRDLQTMYSIFVNEQPNDVIHLAALGSVPRSWDQPGLVTDINERGFINVLQAATAVKCRRFVFASSSSVYGPTDKNVKWEGQQVYPASPYALTKLNNERFAHLWCFTSGMEWMALRFFNVYGPGQRFDSDYSAVIPKWIKSDPITIFGDGTTIRDFTYVADVCRGIFKSLICKERNEIINIGTGFGTNLETLATTIQSIIPKEIKHGDFRPGDSRISIADPNKMQNILGLKSMSKIEDGLKETIAFYQSLDGKG